MSDSVSRAAACAALRIGDRQLRKLLVTGRLVACGSGHSARITAASLADEMARRKQIRNHMPEIAELCGIPPGRVPNLSARPIDGQQNSGHHEGVSRSMSSPGGQIGVGELELLPLARAAAVVGLSDRSLKQAIDRGELPCVRVGERQRVAVAALREWVMGRGNAR